MAAVLSGHQEPMQIKRWERFSRAAKLAFERKTFEESRSLNNTALELALNGFEDEFFREPERAVARVMISHFNLADIYKAQNQPHEAITALMKGGRFLDRQFARLHLDEAQQVALLHAASHLRTELGTIGVRCDERHPSASLPTPARFNPKQASVTLH